MQADDQHELRIPRRICGPLRTVRSHCGAAGREIVGGASLLGAYGHGDMAATEASGLLLLNGPSPLLQDEAHTHIYMPLTDIWQRANSRGDGAATEERVFSEALQLPWAVLALTGPANQMWLDPPHRHRPFLEVLFQHWSSLTALDGRYSGGETTGGSLWETGMNIRYALGHLGVPVQHLSHLLNADAAAQLLRSTLRADGL